MRIYGDGFYVVLSPSPSLSLRRRLEKYVRQPPPLNLPPGKYSLTDRTLLGKVLINQNGGMIPR